MVRGPESISIASRVPYLQHATYTRYRNIDWCGDLQAEGQVGPGRVDDVVVGVVGMPPQHLRHENHPSTAQPLLLAQG